MPRPISGTLALLAALLLAGALRADTAAPLLPEGATTPAPETAQPAPLSPAVAAAQAARDAGLPVEAQEWMIVAANPLAAEAGAAVLEAGGSAADAFVAAQAVLGLVEPQSSGLGGGGFLVWHDAASGTTTTLDARETAPAGITPRLFLDAGGQPLIFFDAVIGGRAVGVPGLPALMEEAHRRWGRMPWAGLFAPAVALAETGFAVSPRLAGMIAGDAERLSRAPATAAYFLPGGAPPSAGTLLANPAYAATLRRLAAEGAAGFYSGPVAEAIVAAVRGAPGNPGALSLADLARYRVVERAPVCTPYRGTAVCGMGPPSSGAVAVGQILGMLEGRDLPAMPPFAPETRRLLGDATRLAFADRGRYLADPDHVPVPVTGLLDPAYLATRAEVLGETRLEEAAPGMPEWDHAFLLADDHGHERPATTHVSIIDRHGNALAATTSIENAFGARIMAAGFLLNNQLTDFSFRTHAGGVPIANAPAPLKRPRSSMSPTIVLREGRPVMVLGSPGGATIIPFVAQAIIAVLDWGMDPQQAASMPHAVNLFGRFELEADTPAEALAAPLAAAGYETRARALTSGLHVITLGAGGLSGGADPRREGIALGR